MNNPPFLIEPFYSETNLTKTSDFPFGSFFLKIKLIKPAFYGGLFQTAKCYCYY